MSASNVSVVIPCYNHGHLLKRAVDSALDCGAGQVIIFNDASKDNSGKIWYEHYYQNPSVLYLQNVTQPFPFGTIFARNTAINYAKCPLILPLDADDKLVNIWSLVDAWTPGHWVYGSWMEDGQIIDAPPTGVLNRKELGWVSMLFHKDDWQRVGGYDPVFSVGNEIWAFQRALYCAGVMPMRVPDIVFERNTDAPRTDRARAWAHVIKPLIDAMYPYQQGEYVVK